MAKYTEDSIKSLEWHEHIRRRPGMYIGKLGDGSTPDDGIYVLVKEVIDNSIDEFNMGVGKNLDISIEDGVVTIRDYGRGIPLGKMVDCVSKINTGGKYDNEAFQKSVGMNGVGTKAVNALSSYFWVQSIRDGKTRIAEFSRGLLESESKDKPCKEKQGTIIKFIPDTDIFPKYKFIYDYIEEKIWNYSYLNPGLVITFNGRKFESKNGLHDLLNRHVDDTIRYPILHIAEKNRDIEIALSHANHYGEQYFTFVNGQYTTQGGTHLNAFKEAFVKTIREFFKKDYDAADIRSAIIAAVSVRIQEPIFESQTKTKLGSTHVSEGGETLRKWMADFIRRELDNFLHKNSAVATAILKRIQQSEKERKEIAGIKKLANERAKKANIHNRKLRDCKFHFGGKEDECNDTMIFITEGDSASGSITTARSVKTQAVFSLKGKPLNCFGLSKKVVYENEEFNLLQHALDIENGIDSLRYNKVVIATDADVDGMHIRLLLLTFFIQFFPELIENGHVFILETPLFRVRNKNETIYCYDALEKDVALGRLGKKSEITRFKGLGEISPNEFGKFLREDLRLEPVLLHPEMSKTQLLTRFMGKNTPERQKFIIENLRNVVNDDVAA
ncbi:MAG: type IIA DNA topoisomerase subunit B [Fibrobacterales bacterium]